MLDYMRKKAGSWIIKILLFGIVVVFAFWGIGPYGDDPNTVMTIGKVKVPYTEYRDLYNNLLDSYRQIYENIDPGALESLDLRGQAKNMLLERYLLLEAADRLDITATPEEVNMQITSTPAFQENGIFIPERYQSFLDFNRTTPEAYEASVAKDLIVAKVTDLIKVSATVTPQEVEENLMLLTRQAVASVIPLTANDFVRKVPAPTEDDLQDYYDDHQDLYRVPETFRQAVAVIDPADFSAKVVVSTEDLEDLYRQMTLDFLIPAAYRVRHILFAIPEEATAASIGEVRTLAEEVAGRIRDGKITFEAAAKRYSDDPNSASKGGDLGFLEERELDPALLQAMRDLDEEDVSDPVPTNRGFEVFLGGEYREERVRALEEVREEVEEKLRSEKAFDMAFDMADDLLDEVSDTDRPLEELAKEKGLALKITPYFSRETDFETLGLPEALVRAGFETESGEIGDVYEDDGKLFIFQTVDRKDAHVPAFADVRKEVEGGIIVQRGLEMARDKAAELLDGLEKGKSMEWAASSLGKSPVTPKPFTVMDSSLPGLEDGERIIETAFAIRKEGGAATASGPRTHYIVMLDRMILPKEEDIAQQRAAVREALKFQREQEVLGGYIQGIRKELGDKITINEKLM